MTIELDENAKKFIIDKGYDSKYGARPLKRAIQTYIEDPLAEEILESRIKAGNKVLVSCKADKIEFSVKRGINH